MIISKKATCQNNGTSCNNDGEIGISLTGSCIAENVVVTLYNNTGTPLGSPVTITSGNPLIAHFGGVAPGLYRINVAYGSSGTCLLDQWVLIECDCAQSVAPGSPTINITNSCINLPCNFTNCWQFDPGTPLSQNILYNAYTTNVSTTNRSVEIPLNNGGDCACSTPTRGSRGDIMVWVRQSTNVVPVPGSYTQEFIYPDIYIDPVNCMAYIWFLEPPTFSFIVCVMRADANTNP